MIILTNQRLLTKKLHNYDVNLSKFVMNLNSKLGLGPIDPTAIV